MIKTIINKIKNKDAYTITTVIIILAFLECLLINIIVPFNIGLHDEGAFKDFFQEGIFLDGNFGYIEYLCKYRHLPDFDVREVWGFYNPPFFHIVGAVLASFFSTFIKSSRGIEEALQFMNVFAYLLCMIYFRKLIFKFRIDDNSMIISIIAFSFHPWFVLFSMMFSTDMFTLMFLIMILYYTYLFYNEQSYSNIVKLALSFGFGMMTKLSVGLMSIPCGFIMLYILIKNIKKFSFKTRSFNLIFKYIVFLLICAPLGLFNPIRNYIMFKIPITYIQPIPTMDPTPKIDYMGLPNIIEYIIKPMNYDTTLNIWMGAIRSSIFDEFNFGEQVRLIGSISMALYIVVIFSFVALFIFIKNKRKYFNSISSNAYVVMLILIFVVFLVSYARFNYFFPVNATSNFRYISVCLPVFIILISYLINYYKNIFVNYFLLISSIIIHLLFMLYFVYGYMIFRNSI